MKIRMLRLVLFLSILCMAGIVLGQMGEAVGQIEKPPTIRVEKEAIPEVPGMKDVLAAKGLGLKTEAPEERDLQEAPIRPRSAVLSELTPAEKSNATLSIDGAKDYPSSLLNELELIEKLWNSDQSAEALERLENLEADQSPLDIEIGMSWKTPVPMSKSLWGTDVLINNDQMPNLLGHKVDSHPGTGHVFAVILHGDEISINFSTNQGASWSQTHRYFIAATVNDVDGRVRGDHFYIAYVSQADKDVFRIRRFNASDGSYDSGYGINDVFDNDLEIKEVAIAGQPGGTSPQMYAMAIMNDNTLVYYWGTTTWTEASPGLSDADKGLDSVYDTYSGGDNYYFFASYIGTDDKLHVARRKPAQWDFYTSADAIASIALNETAIAAQNDTIITLFEYAFANDNGIRYRISYDDGVTWLYYNLAEPTTSGHPFYAPSVTMDGGQGIAAAFCYEGGTFDPVYYTHRPYKSVQWLNDVQINDHDSQTGFGTAICFMKPVGSEYRAYGITYKRHDTDLRIYFDRDGTITSVNDTEPALPTAFSLSRNYPNPFNASTVIEYQLPERADVTLQIIDMRGRIVRTLEAGSTKEAGSHTITWHGTDNSGLTVPSGLYLLQLKAGSFTQHQKMLLTK